MIPWQDPPPQNVFPPAVNYPSGDCCQFVENPCDCGGGGGGYFYPTEGPHVDKPDKPNGDGKRKTKCVGRNVDLNRF